MSHCSARIAIRIPRSLAASCRRAAARVSQLCRKIGLIRTLTPRPTAWFVWTVCLTLGFGRMAAYNLGNYRPVTNDEGELISVAYKLATQGVMGSDLFAGFFGADQHFFFVLPVQHVLEAVTFRVFGAGIAQARWVSLVAGVSIVWLVGWLAWRWYGLGDGHRVRAAAGRLAVGFHRCRVRVAVVRRRANGALRRAGGGIRVARPRAVGCLPPPPAGPERVRASASAAAWPH